MGFHIKGGRGGVSQGVPLRPILAAYNTASYGISKFIILLIEKLCINGYTIENSNDFVAQLKHVPINPGTCMISFDASSLYTNVPVSETLDIVLKNLFVDEDVLYLGYSRKLFFEMLNLAVCNTYFFFNKILYKQKDGLAMGNPLAPTLANIFLCDLETTFLNNCPLEFKPIYYRRYLDDIFAIFSSKEQISKFYEYINNYHINIEFTVEEESEGKLSFLDVLVDRDSRAVQCSVYRKPTFTNLGTSFFSFIPTVYKINSIRTLVHRAYHLSSSFFTFQKEVDFLRNYFEINGYPSFCIDKCLKQFLNKVYHPTEPVITVPREQIFIKLLYLGQNSVDLVDFFVETLKKNVTLK